MQLNFQPRSSQSSSSSSPVKQPKTIEKTSNSDSDNEEALDFYIHTIDNSLLGSTSDKQTKVLNYFNFFLRYYCTQNKIKPMKAKDIPYQSFPPTNNSKTIAKFWD